MLSFLFFYWSVSHLGDHKFIFDIENLFLILVLANWENATPSHGVLDGHILSTCRIDVILKLVQFSRSCFQFSKARLADGADSDFNDWVFKDEPCLCGSSDLSCRSFQQRDQVERQVVDVCFRNAPINFRIWIISYTDSIFNQVVFDDI